MDPRVRAESIRTLYLQMRNATAAAMIVTVYMAATAWAFSPHDEVLGWLAVQLLSQVGREALRRSFSARARHDEELEPWARRSAIYMGVAGAIWGGTIILFAHPAQPITVALTLCGLYGISGGSVPGNAYNPTGLYAFVGTIFAIVLARLLAIGDFDYAVLGFASAGFALIMIGFCRVQAGAIAESFRIRFENEQLLAALAREKGEADAARAKAESASLAKSQFLAAASHDLRQPLYALGLFSASLKELKLDAAGRETVARIGGSIGAMERLFDGLLDISKLEAGAVVAHLEPVDVDALFDRLSGYHRPIALAKGLDLRLRSDGEWVLSDPVLLEQVLSNLVANAIRCADDGGVLIAVRHREGQLRFEVWDTGIGIAEPDRARIFEEFVQLGNPERDRRKGLGLGLSIARRAAELLGARIAVASKPGRGSRFSFCQPLCEASVATVTLHVAAPPVARGRVLVIDDDADVRAALGELLRRWDVAHDLAGDAEEARRLAAGNDYALVMCDQRLPGATDGLTLLSALAVILPAAARVLITADFDPALLAAAEAAGVPLLHKPVAPDTLRALVGADRTPVG
ncbi:ATP-binding protein [Sphingomonas antarctica]|uniref:ATP-binding response regulator n=1 Tax=Sphingomonas antarctica TaxID=2040274 RepID=UPI0039EA4F58